MYLWLKTNRLQLQAITWMNHWNITLKKVSYIKFHVYSFKTWKWLSRCDKATKKSKTQNPEWHSLKGKNVRRSQGRMHKINFRDNITFLMWSKYVINILMSFLTFKVTINRVNNNTVSLPSPFSMFIYNWRSNGISLF